MGFSRHRQCCGWIATLRADHPVPAVHGTPVGEGGFYVRIRLPGMRQHLSGEGNREGDDVRWAAAGEHFHRLPHLIGVADGKTERHVHVGEQRGCRDAGILAERNHRLGELARLGDVLEKGPRAELHVEHERRRTLGDFLRHDRRRDEGNRLDRASDVAECVELAVCGSESGSGRADHRADLVEDLPHPRAGDIRLPAGNRLELVQRATRVAEPAPGELGHGDSEARDEWRERQGDFVAHPSGRVLVRSPLGETGEVHRLAGGDHREREVADLATLHAVEEDRHSHGCHLLVGNITPGVRIDKPADLLGRERSAVALGVDQIDDVEGFDGHGESPISGEDCERKSPGKIAGEWDGSVGLAVLGELTWAEGIRDHFVNRLHA